MSPFLITTHLSEITERSWIEPVVIFKYSSECSSSKDVSEDLEKRIAEKKLASPVYLVTVQTLPVMSDKIREMFNIKHESPQIIILNKGKVTYEAHHLAINPDKFVFN
jgi:bacillithiol system protein YtxJ